MIHLLLSAALATPLSPWLDQVPPPPGDRPDHARAYRWTAEVFGDVEEALRASPWPHQVERFGESTDGRPLWAVHLWHPTAPPERRVLVFAGIHALEWISTEVATELVLRLAARPVPGVEVTVVPLLNPDGRARVERDLAAGENTYRRGNRANVDLNRDFAVNREARGPWKALIPGYYETSPGPLSQPETRALDALVAREGYERAASLHAFGKFIYYPWSGRFHRPPDRDDFETLGRAMQDAQGGGHYEVRQLSRWGFFFRAQGSEIDHLYAVHGTRAFLVELTGSGIRPWRPRTAWQYFSWYNPERPERHVERGVRAVMALVRHPPLPGEGQPPTPDPRVDIHRKP